MFSDKVFPCELISELENAGRHPRNELQDGISFDNQACEKFKPQNFN